jgi:transposase-like protein
MSEKRGTQMGRGVSPVERAPGASGAGDKRPGRWSAKRKREVVLRLLRGEDLETLCRELGVTAARLSAWRDEFLAGGEDQLKSRASSVRDREVRQLQRKLGELTMENELLRDKARRLEEKAPDFPWRRSNR